MSHYRYETKAFVLRAQPHGEANKTYVLFTRDFGLITVRAQGIRQLASKLRYHLDELQFLLVSIVRGRETWRLVGTREDIGVDLRNPSRRRLLARIAALLERLIHGEEKNEALFDTLYSLALFIQTNDVHDKIFLIAAARILYILGYLTPLPEYRELVTTTDWNQETLELAAGIEEELKVAVTEGLAHTHL